MMTILRRRMLRQPLPALLRGSGRRRWFSSEAAIRISSGDIVSTLTDWMKPDPQNHNQLLVDRILRVLRSPSGESDNLLLSNLRLQVSEGLVLSVLSQGCRDRNDILSCLKFFDWVSRQPGFHHTRATYHALFKILRRAGLRSGMLEILESSVKSQSFRHSLRLSDALVIGYSVAGRPEIALQHFAIMRFRGLDLDSYGYHVLLNSLVEENCFDTVDVIANQITSRGFVCPVTHSILVKSLCKQSRLTDAEHYFRDLLTHDLEGCAYSFGILIGSLCSNDKFEHAATLLDEMKELGTVRMDRAYSTWIKALIRARNLTGAVEVLKNLGSVQGFNVEVYRYNSLILKLLRKGQLMEVCDVLIGMAEKGVPPDNGTMNAVLCFFCKTGMLDVALGLYESKSEMGLTPSAMAYSYLINSLCLHDAVEQANSILNVALAQGYFPGRVTFYNLTEALCRKGKVDQLRDLVLVALRRNILPSRLAYGKYVTALCEAERVEDGLVMLSELSKAGIGTTERMYVSLIQSSVRSLRGDVAAKLLVQMQEKGYYPRREFYRTVIQCLCEMENGEKHLIDLLRMQLGIVGFRVESYNYFIDGAGHAKRPEIAREVYDMMEREGIKPNLDSEILMLQSYLNSRKYTQAVNFFDTLYQKGKVKTKLYNTMIVGLCKARKGETAKYFLDKMISDGLNPSIISYEEVILIMCANGRYDEAVSLVEQFRNRGRSLTSFIGNTLLLNASKTPDLYEAWIRRKGVDENEWPDMKLLGQLIGFFSGRVRLEGCIETLDDVIEQCYTPDVRTYNMLLRRLMREEADVALKMVYKMCERGHEPDTKTYSILQRGYFQAVKTNMVSERWDEMKKYLTSVLQRSSILHTSYNNKL